MDTGERRQEYFPDGTPIDDWFYDTSVPEPAELGRPYVLTDYDIWDDGKIYTKQIQRVIDLAAGEGAAFSSSRPGRIGREHCTSGRGSTFMSAPGERSRGAMTSRITTCARRA